MAVALVSGPRDCASCAHWMPPKAEGPGECRHRSPRAVEFRPGCWRSQWPPTWALDWCASHRPLEEQERAYELVGDAPPIEEERR